MSNHGNSPFPKDEKFEALDQERNKLMRSLLDATKFRGALGEFKEGKLTEDDEGGIQFAIGEEKGKVVLDFGSQVHWVAMTPQQAADLASSLLNKARAAARRNGESVGFTIGMHAPEKILKAASE